MEVPFTSQSPPQVPRDLHLAAGLELKRWHTVLNTATQLVREFRKESCPEVLEALHAGCEACFQAGNEALRLLSLPDSARPGGSEGTPSAEAVAFVAQLERQLQEAIAARDADAAVKRRALGAAFLGLLGVLRETGWSQCASLTCDRLFPSLDKLVKTLAAGRSPAANARSRGRGRVPRPAGMCEKLIRAGDVVGLADYLAGLGPAQLPFNAVFTLSRALRQKARQDPAGFSDDVFGDVVGFGFFVFGRCRQVVETRIQQHDDSRRNANSLPASLIEEGWIDRLERLEKHLVELLELQARVKHLGALSDHGARQQEAKGPRLVREVGRNPDPAGTVKAKAG